MFVPPKTGAFRMNNIFTINFCLNHTPFLPNENVLKYGTSVPRLVLLFSEFSFPDFQFYKFSFSAAAGCPPNWISSLFPTYQTVTGERKKGLGKEGAEGTKGFFSARKTFPLTLQRKGEISVWASLHPPFCVLNFALSVQGKGTKGTVEMKKV